MSNPYSRRPGDPSSTPSRNFSHPNRQHDISLSPDDSQDNPPMAPNDSRRMLPLLPSRVFSRSTSNVSLQTERYRHADFDFGYEPSARPGTSHTAISSFSVPDLTATALPQMRSNTAPPVPQIPHRFGGPAPIALNPPSPGRQINPPPRSPAKSSNGSGWRRLKVKVKKALSFGRKKKMKIGGPTDFRHEQTHGSYPLRAPGTGLLTMAPRLPIPGGTDREGVMMGGSLGSVCSDSKPTANQSATTGAGQGEAIRDGRLGHRDADGTAVSDDDDSDWEDQETSRLFQSWQQSQKRRH